MVSKYHKYIVLSIIFALCLFPTFSFAANDDDDSSDYGDKLSDTQDLIKEYEAKILQLRAEEHSLANQIAQMDSEIYVTSLRIQESEVVLEQKKEELEELSVDIEKVTERIERLGESMDFQQGVFGERVRAAYKSSTRLSPLEMFMSSSGESLGDLIFRYKYLQVLEERDRELLGQMEKTRDNYQVQQQYLNQKKLRVEEVKAQVEKEMAFLEQQKVDLVVQQQDKAYLLQVTQNDEAKYQELLSIAYAEMRAIEAIFASLDFSDGEEVEKGDVIAVMGNTGYPVCSTDTHLHFEVREDGTPVNPARYLEDRSVVNDTCVEGACDNLPNFSGDWEWPMRDTVYITQVFGRSVFARTIRGSIMYEYSGGIHTGIDMYNNSNTLIYAPEGGVAIKSSGYCGSSVYNYVAIDHGDDVVSLYLHVQ